MNKVYPLAKQRLLEYVLGAGHPGSAVLCIIGVKASYVYDDAHVTLADVPGASIVMPEKVLTGVTNVGGLVKADNVNATGMTTGQTMTALIVYAKWGSESLLLAYADSPTDGSLPQVINSTAGIVSFDSAGIFRI